MGTAKKASKARVARTDVPLRKPVVIIPAEEDSSAKAAKESAKLVAENVVKDKEKRIANMEIVPVSPSPTGVVENQKPPKFFAAPGAIIEKRLDVYFPHTHSVNPMEHVEEFDLQDDDLIYRLSGIGTSNNVGKYFILSAEQQTKQWQAVNDMPHNSVLFDRVGGIDEDGTELIQKEVAV